MYEGTRFAPTVHTDVWEIPAVLGELRESQLPGRGLLSAYLPTPPTSVAGRKYLVRFREECKAIRQRLEEASRDERQAFEAAVGRVEEYLDQMAVPRHPGLAVFAGQERGHLYAVPLPEQPVTLIVWDTQPILAPLEEILDEYERIAVVLTDRRQARLFTIYLGAIEEQQVVESDDPGKRTVSGIAGNFAQHYQENVRRHLRQTIHATMDLLRARPFDRLLLGGPVDVDTMLRDELPRPLRSRYADMLSIGLDATDAEVLETARRAAEAIERQVEREMVDELIAARTTPRAAIGLEDTLDALHDERVHRLFLVSDFAGSADECPNCGRIVAGTGECPGCGASLKPVADLRELVVDRALEQAAHVEMVSGEAADELRKYEGIGAWTRY